MIDPKMHTLLVAIRQALLAAVDAIEVYCDLPRTSSLRKAQKEADRH